MPQQPDSATPTRLCKINASRVGHKIRVAGRVLSYDAESGHIVLLDGDCAVLVDASLCLNVRSSTWVRERLSKIIAICYVEGSPKLLSITSFHGYTPEPDINPQPVLRAILVVAAPGLDLELWNSVIEEGGDLGTDLVE